MRPKPHITSASLPRHFWPPPLQPPSSTRGCFSLRPHPFAVTFRKVGGCHQPAPLPSLAVLLDSLLWWQAAGTSNAKRAPRATVSESCCRVFIRGDARGMFVRACLRARARARRLCAKQKWNLIFASNNKVVDTPDAAASSCSHRRFIDGGWIWEGTQCCWRCCRCWC